MMAGLPWFGVASDFPGHPKTVRLAALLRDANAGMHVIRLLAHCATYAPDGRIREDMVEHAAGWTKKAGVFLAAAVAVGFLEGDCGVYIVHGWVERNGAHVRKAVRDAKNPRGNLPKTASVQPPSSARPALESERERDKKIEACADLALPGSAPEPPVFVLPCVGNGPKEYAVTEQQIREWRDAFPGVDVLAEVRKARAWLDANRRRRKTYRGMPAFLVSWMNRAQNRGGSRSGATNGRPEEERQQFLAALASAERYAAGSEPEAGDGRDGPGLRSDEDRDEVADVVAEASAPLPAEARTPLVHRWSTR